MLSDINKEYIDSGKTNVNDNDIEYTIHIENVINGFYEKVIYLSQIINKISGTILQINKTMANFEKIAMEVDNTSTYKNKLTEEIKEMYTMDYSLDKDVTQSLSDLDSLKYIIPDYLEAIDKAIYSIKQNLTVEILDLGENTNSAHVWMLRNKLNDAESLKELGESLYNQIDMVKKTGEIAKWKFQGLLRKTIPVLKELYINEKQWINPQDLHLTLSEKDLRLQLTETCPANTDKQSSNNKDINNIKWEGNTGKPYIMDSLDYRYIKNVEKKYPNCYEEGFVWPDRTSEKISKAAKKTADVTSEVLKDAVANTLGFVVELPENIASGVLRVKDKLTGNN